jgi:hypothetical protein
MSTSNTQLKADDTTCTCGCQYHANIALDAFGDNFGDSFVHLPKQFTQQQLPKHTIVTVRDNQTGFLGNYLHLQALEKVTTNPLNNPLPICTECVQRVEKAVTTDIERLQRETFQLRRATKEEEQIGQSWSRVVCELTTENAIDAIKLRKDAYQAEVQMLQEACQQQKEELNRLVAIHIDQARITSTLDDLAFAIDEEINALELQARAFNYEQEQLFRVFAESVGQLQRLSSPQIRLPSLLFRLQIDKDRGLRYPLINNLRLAYRPKGDVIRNEIQIAWSLASQLLLAVATSFGIESIQWKIVPLSHCAKIIFAPKSQNTSTQSLVETNQAMVFNIGSCRGKESSSLLAWNAVLHQVVCHAAVKCHDAVESGMLDAASVPALPYEISRSKIADLVLDQVGDDDDAGWSRVIHCMICDLDWLSNRSADFMARNVGLLTSTFGMAL